MRGEVCREGLGGVVCGGKVCEERGVWGGVLRGVGGSSV